MLAIFGTFFAIFMWKSVKNWLQEWVFNIYKWTLGRSRWIAYFENYPQKWFGDRYGEFPRSRWIEYFENYLQKWFGENLVGKSCRKSCGKILWEILQENLGEILQENLVGNLAGKSCGKSCGKFLWEILWEIVVGKIVWWCLIACRAKTWQKTLMLAIFDTFFAVFSPLQAIEHHQTIFFL